MVLAITKYGKGEALGGRGWGEWGRGNRDRRGSDRNLAESAILGGAY